MAGFFKDLFNGDFEQVWMDIVKGFNRLPQWVKDFLTRVEGDAEDLFISLVEEGAKNIAAAGFTKESFVTEGKAIVAKAASQGQTILISDAIAALNQATAKSNPANATALAGS